MFDDLLFQWQVASSITIMVYFPSTSSTIRMFSKSGWWFQPLWKIWVRQLGWWNSQYIMENNPNVPKHQPEIADNSCCFGLGLVRSVLLVETFVKNTALQHQTFEVYVGVWHGASTYFDILEGNYYWVKIYPLVNVYKKLLKMVIEIVDLQYPLKMVIFHSYVSLPEGK